MAHAPPRDSPDLALLMSFVTSVGGIAAYGMRHSTLGAASGLGVAALFAYGGLQMMVRETAAPLFVAGTL